MKTAVHCEPVSNSSDHTSFRRGQTSNVPNTPRCPIEPVTTTTTGKVIGLVRSNVNQARVFPIGIGCGASTYLINGIARAGRGVATFIREAIHPRPQGSGNPNLWVMQPDAYPERVKDESLIPNNPRAHMNMLNKREGPDSEKKFSGEQICVLRADFSFPINMGRVEITQDKTMPITGVPLQEMRAATMQILNAALQPRASNVKVHWQLMVTNSTDQLAPLDVIVVPQHVPPIFNQCFATVFGFFDYRIQDYDPAHGGERPTLGLLPVYQQQLEAWARENQGFSFQCVDYETDCHCM
ncbi:unnamed protein product [Echinostoma caproni]|uniref:Piwi domain-containing protein n=1 Tax=Echinostoma caproni TaxID=27848 RepID=A0A183AVC9_9TREM|nr:unnamed protein product [Echinostoma caproni]